MSTALDMKQGERQRYIKSALRRRSRQTVSEETAKRREELIRSARDAASLLKRQFGIAQIIELFGNLRLTRNRLQMPPVHTGPDIQ